MKLWCTNQMISEDNEILCCAHLAESRVFNCPYENNEQRIKVKYPCSDYKESQEEEIE